MLVLFALTLELGYGIAGFLLYRARVLYHPAWDSDAVIFLLPFVTMVAIAAVLLSRLFPPQWTRRQRILGGLAVATALTVVAFLAYMTAAINTYGA